MDIFHFRKGGGEVDYLGNDGGIEGIKASISSFLEEHLIFDYNYSMAYNTFDRYPLPSGCKVMKVGDVHLYRDEVIQGEFMKKRVIHSIHDKLEKMRHEKIVDFNGDKEMFYYQGVLDRLENGYIYDDNDLERMRVQDRYCSIFLDNYGLKGDRWFDRDVMDGNERVLTRKYPSSSVSEHIRYI